MAANLVSLVTQFLTPDLIGRIATALGLDRNKVQAAISSAVPTLLAAFNNSANQPGGRRSSPTRQISKRVGFIALD